MIGGDGINDESNKTAPPPTVQVNLTKYNYLYHLTNVVSSVGEYPFWFLFLS